MLRTWGWVATGAGAWVAWVVAWVVAGVGLAPQVVVGAVALDLVAAGVVAGGCAA